MKNKHNECNNCSSVAISKKIPLFYSLAVHLFLANISDLKQNAQERKTTN